MKKLFHLTIIVCLTCVLLFQNFTVFAENVDSQNEWQDIELSQEEFNSILANNPNNYISTYATGLISEYSIGIQKSGNTLIITGKTYCISTVVKCGFKELIIQRKTASATSWSDYQTYTDLYIDSCSYTLSKSLTVPSGYQYRVVCTHYAKKNILSTQKIDNTSNVV